jgi:hypothetical protein
VPPSAPAPQKCAQAPCSLEVRRGASPFPLESQLTIGAAGRRSHAPHRHSFDPSSALPELPPQLPSAARRSESGCRRGESVAECVPHVVVERSDTIAPPRDPKHIPRPRLLPDLLALNRNVIQSELLSADRGVRCPP